MIKDIAKNWEVGLSILYDKQKFLKEFASVLSDYGIDKQSQILDAAAGIGFPSLDLIKKGYRITLSDSSEKMLKALENNAQNLGLNDLEIYNLPWQKLGKNLNKKYDLVLCRGNSLIYVKSWDKRVKNFVSVKKDIILSLKNFYKVLKPGGLFWVDITSDQEIAKGNRNIEKFKRVIDGKNLELIWSIYHNKKIRLRKVKGIFKAEKRIYYGLTFYSYLMSSDELAKMLEKVGFTDIKRVLLKQEVYTVLTARKL